MYIKQLNSIFKSLQKGKAARLWYYPSKVSIETGNICNLRCPLCPTNDPAEKDIKKGLMKFQDFKVIFDKIRPFVKTLDLFNWGEPFLNPDIGRMIAYAREKSPKIRIFIDSNLNVISDDLVDAIVRNALDSLKVSCDGATQGVYEQYRIGGKLADVLRNIERVTAKKKELNSDRPRIIWKYLVFKHNEHEVAKAAQMARDMGIEFEASGMRVNCGKEIFEQVGSSVERDKEWIPDSTEYNNYKDLSSGKRSCAKPWTTLTVNWNGEAVPCGAIYDCAKYSYGNLLKESFDKVWNGKSFIAAREVITGKMDKADVICSVCKANGYQFF